MEKANEMDVVFKKRFQNKVLKLSKYLETAFGMKTVNGFWKEFDYQISIIRKYPESGAPCRVNGVRSFKAGKHCRVYYKIESQRILIINIYDMRQNPSKKIYQ